MRNLRAAACLAALVLALGGCTTPAQRADLEASRLGFVRRDVRGLQFVHAVYARPPAGPEAPPVGPLHVYIGGDGSPRRALRWTPADPTPDSLMLRLMALDRSESIYLGRPCYHATSPCSAELLTIGRYSEAVVESMALALEHSRAPGRSIVLLGHSGGGTLAMLLAGRAAGVRAVVTIAGNLDVAAFAHLHGFLPLSDSLDPSAAPPLPPALRQLHLVGGRDDVVPEALIRAAAQRQPAAEVRVFPKLTHEGPWEGVWPEVLAELDRLLANSPPDASQNWSRPPSVTR